MQIWAEEARKGDVHITIKCTCKLLVPISSTTKPGDYFSIWLEDENTARFIVHYNDVSVTIHRNTFRAHELSRPNFGLKGKTQNSKRCWHDRNNCIAGSQWDRETLLSSKVSQRGWFSSAPIVYFIFFSSAENRDCFLYVLSWVESLAPQQLSLNIQLMRNTIIRFVCLDKLQHLSETITNVCIASSSVPAG